MDINGSEFFNEFSFFLKYRIQGTLPLQVL